MLTSVYLIVQKLAKGGDSNSFKHSAVVNTYRIDKKEKKKALERQLTMYVYTTKRYGITWTETLLASEAKWMRSKPELSTLTGLARLRLRKGCQNVCRLTAEIVAVAIVSVLQLKPCGSPSIGSKGSVCHHSLTPVRAVSRTSAVFTCHSHKYSPN